MMADIFVFLRGELRMGGCITDRSSRRSVGVSELGFGPVVVQTLIKDGLEICLWKTASECLVLLMMVINKNHTTTAGHITILYAPPRKYTTEISRPRDPIPPFHRAIEPYSKNPDPIQPRAPPRALPRAERSSFTPGSGSRKQDKSCQHDTKSSPSHKHSRAADQSEHRVPGMNRQDSSDVCAGAVRSGTMFGRTLQQEAGLGGGRVRAAKGSGLMAQAWARLLG